MADCPATKDGYHVVKSGVEYVEDPKTGQRKAVVYYYCTACGARE